MSTLVADVRSLLDVASRGSTEENRRRLERATQSLDGPLRVALVGRMKAGKSTLLNAIVGDRVAPTDATECTRVITEYRQGLAYRATAVLDGGRHEMLRFDRTDQGAVIDLGRHRPNEIARIDVEFPSPQLRDVVLVDTPGTTSMTESIATASRTISSVRSADLDVDVIVCIMRQLDPHDVDFLESFSGPGLRALGAVNAVAVLARADEVGGGGPTAMADARAMAAAWQRLPMFRRMVGGVIPVAALLAESASALSETDFRALSGVADRLVPEEGAALTSVDQFMEHKAFELGPAQCERLVRMLGLHGLVASLRWMRLGMADSSSAYVERLCVHSGIDEVRRWVFGTLVARRDALKVQRALDLVDDVLTSGGPTDPTVGRELERVRANAHELAELQALNRLRSDDDLDVTAEQRAALWRVLGGDGTSVDRRMATSDGHATTAELDRWRRIAGDSMSGPDLQWLARLAIRSIGSLKPAEAAAPEA